MITRTLGRTGLEVTQLSFGTLELRGPKSWSGRPVTDRQADELLNAVLDEGINFIDTAPEYGDSEEYIGRFISSRRNEFRLATKCGCEPEDRGERLELLHRWSGDTLLGNIDASLARMQTDHIDLLQLHNPTVDEVRHGGLVEVLRSIQEQGLARFIGVSTTLPHLLGFLEMGVFDVFQVPYSALEPRHHDAISMVAEAGAGVIIRGGIAQGGPRSGQAHRFRADIWHQADLQDLCDGMSPAELLLRYTLTHPHCHTSLVGTLSVDHLRQNVQAAARGPLPPALYHEIRQRVAAAMTTRI